MEGKRLAGALKEIFTGVAGMTSAGGGVIAAVNAVAAGVMHAGAKVTSEWAALGAVLLTAGILLIRKIEKDNRAPPAPKL
jgi:hypothetical protein